MRHEIEFYYRPEKPVPFSSLTAHLLEEDFSSLKTEHDVQLIENRWNGIVEAAERNGKKVFSKPRGLAMLFDTQGTTLAYKTTEYKDYNSVSTTSNEKSLSPRLYETMRVAAVGATLELGDGSIFIHRRSYQATHVAGVIDSSCAGLCFVRDGKINPEQDLLQKLEKELGLKREEVEIKGIVGIHSAYAPDFSGLIDVALKTPLMPGDLAVRTKDIDFPERLYVLKEDLPDFVYHHYIEDKDMVGDGAAILLSCLDEKKFRESIEKMQRAGKDISFGNLVQGTFSPLM